MVVSIKIILERMSAKIVQAVGLAGLALILFILPSGAGAVPLAPINVTSEWTTGGFNVNYSGVEIGALVKVYYRYDYNKEEMPFEVVNTFVAITSNGTFKVQGLPNGTTYYWAITQTVEGVESEKSNIFSGTPPFTTFIINWPEILIDINDAIVNALEGVFSPSNAAIDNLTASIDSLKDALGVNAVTGAGNQLVTGFDNAKNNLKSPVVTDDGIGTFTGGGSPNDLPDLNGTMNDLSWKVPITKLPNGEFFYVTLFSDEQLEKLKWWAVVKDLVGITIFITFGFWVVVRFTPAFKV